MNIKARLCDTIDVNIIDFVVKYEDLYAVVVKSGGELDYCPYRKLTVIDKNYTPGGED